MNSEGMLRCSEYPPLRQCRDATGIAAAFRYDRGWYKSDVGGRGR
jgi:hypothetical protein